MEYHFLFLLPPLLLTMKQFKINTQNYWLIQLRRIPTGSIEGKQRYLADNILYRWMSLLKDWLN